MMDAKGGKSTKNELKIIVVGNSGTGKTSFVNKWTKGTFDKVYKPTIVSEFSYKVQEFKGKPYKIQLWDLAGQDQNTCITKIFSKNSHGVIVLSDITNDKSIEEYDYYISHPYLIYRSIKWKYSVDENAKFLDGDYLPSVLVRNKVDLLEEGEENKNDESVKEFAEKNKFINVFKTSAMMGIGINECMEFLINSIIERMEKCAVAGKDTFPQDNKVNIILNAKPREVEPQGGMCGCS